VPASGLFNAADVFVDRNLLEGRGEKIAIECGAERVTYGQLAERVNRLGDALRTELEVRIEERVALLLVDSPAFAYSFFGAIKIGAVPVPINTLWKARDYAYVLNDTRARVAIVSEALLPRLREIPRTDLTHLKHLVVVGAPERDAHRFDGLIEAGAPNISPADTTIDDAAFWLYSSGSTGVPKGCVHLQHDMTVCAEGYGRGVLGMRESDRCFSVAKLFFAYGLGNALYMPFSVGATSILWPGAPTAADVFTVVERHRPTLFFSVPTGYAMLLACQRARQAGDSADPPVGGDGGPGDFDLSSIRHAVSAGEALPPPLFERFRARFGLEILDGIGSTETLHMFLSNRPGAVRPGSSGVPVPGYEVRILDDDRRPVPTGEIGNLFVKGDSICAGYWNQHAKTTETIEGQWIRTGDKFSQDADGFFWHCGRADDMLKVGGLWVSPVEVERALLAHADVQECAVIGREDGDGLVKPLAFVVLRAGVTPAPDMPLELMEIVRAQLPDYKRPRWVEFVAELPKTATGKIQRYRLREAVAQP
jgi:benzoate-CoA ligase family protein